MLSKQFKPIPHVPRIDLLHCKSYVLSGTQEEQKRKASPASLKLELREVLPKVIALEERISFSCINLSKPLSLGNAWNTIPNEFKMYTCTCM
jgi:hypothetical protein